MRKFRLALTALVALLLVVGLVVARQDSKAPADQLKGPLPPHYRKLNLSEEQLQKIRNIQKEYRGKLRDLKKQYLT